MVCSLIVFFVFVQVFYAITRLVLNTKKESAKDGGTKDTIKVNKSSGKKQKKGGCCS